MLPPIVHDLLSISNSLILVGIFYKISVMTYQHKLMWVDFVKRKGINGTISKAVAGE